NIRETLEVRRRVDRSREPLRETEMPLDHGAMAGSSVGAQRRPDRDAACASRRFWSAPTEHRVLAGLRQVRRADRERRVEEGGIANECEARVIGHVEPLVRVGNDGVRALDAGREMRRARRYPREETEGTVDMQPAVIPLR